MSALLLERASVRKMPIARSAAGMSMKAAVSPGIAHPSLPPRVDFSKKGSNKRARSNLLPYVQRHESRCRGIEKEEDTWL